MKPRVEVVFVAYERVAQLTACSDRWLGLAGQSETAAVEAVILDRLRLVKDRLDLLAAFAVRLAMSSVDDDVCQPGELMSVRDQPAVAERSRFYVEIDSGQTTLSRRRGVGSGRVKDVMDELELSQWLMKGQ